jgi:hypothetical protein
MVEPLQVVVDAGSDDQRQARLPAQERFWLQRSPRWPEGRQHLVSVLFGPQAP